MLDQKYPILKIVGIFLVVKVIYLLFSISIIEIGLLDENYNFSIESYGDMAMRKDAFWYKDITINGYPIGHLRSDGSRLYDFSKGQSSLAFFPVYPLFNRLLIDYFPINYEKAAFISSLFFSISALIACFLFFCEYWKNTTKALFTTLVIFLFPFHFYFSMFLTEAPFFAFLLWSFYAIQKRQLFLSSLLLIPLVLIRANGIFMLLPLYMFYLEQCKIPYTDFYKSRRSMKGLLVCLPSVIFFFMYLGYQYKMTGYFLAFSEAQSAWNRAFTFPLFSLFRQGNFNYQFTSWYVIIMTLIMILYRNQISWSFKTMILISILLPLSTGSTYSIVRYFSVVFPIFIIISNLLYNSNFKILILTLLFILQLTSFYLWIADYPLGF